MCRCLIRTIKKSLDGYRIASCRLVFDSFLLKETSRQLASFFSNELEGINPEIPVSISIRHS